MMRLEKRICNVKKNVWVLVMCFLLFATFSTTVLADTDLGTLSCWYSDDNRIARWNESSIDVYVNKINSNGNFYFSMGISEGCSQWDDAINMAVNYSPLNTSALIQYHGGTVDEINEYGEFVVDSSVNGVTQITKSLEGTWKYGNTSKKGYLLSSAIGCVVDNDRTTDEYRKTCAHELGHALGWLGHSGNSNDIMFSWGTHKTSLTFRDIDHLSQVY